MESGRAEIIRSFSTPGETPGDLASRSDSLWHVDHDNGGRILCLDRITGRVLHGFKVEGEAEGLTFDGNCLWQVDRRTKVLCRFDPKGGEMLGRLPLPEPIKFAGGLGFDGSQLWQADSEEGKLYALDCHDGRVQQIIEVDAYVCGVACQQGKLYVTEPASKRLAIVDAETGKQLKSFELPGTPTGVALLGDSVWYVDSSLRQICELRLLN